MAFEEHPQCLPDDGMVINKDDPDDIRTSRALLGVRSRVPETNRPADGASGIQGVLPQ
jgi:hypothetical protein